MPKIWKNNRRDIADLKRRLREGDVVYTVRKVSGHVAPYEDARLCVEHEFTWTNRVTGSLMTGHLSIEGLLAQENEIHEQPPRGVRNIADPAPQVGAPLGSNYEGRLDEPELRGLNKHVADGSDPRTRRHPRSWRP
ncbi:hypothetical protein ACFCYX_19435 [Streptomyces populi]|uniref:hypothetical protein n=1 Tax=Streptomyces populi TaxID=2058924 RepID=UPI0035D99CB3